MIKECAKCVHAFTRIKDEPCASCHPATERSAFLSVVEMKAEVERLRAELGAERDAVSRLDAGANRRTKEIVRLRARVAELEAKATRGR